MNILILTSNIAKLKWGYTRLSSKRNTSRHELLTAMQHLLILIF